MTYFRKKQKELETCKYNELKHEHLLLLIVEMKVIEIKLITIHLYQKYSIKSIKINSKNLLS